MDRPELDDLAQQIWYVLRVVASLSPSSMQQIHEEFKESLDDLPPVVAIPLRRLRDRLLSSDASQREADDAVLFLERACDQRGLAAELPEELRRMDPAARRARVDAFAQRFAVELAAQAGVAADDWDQDSTAPIKLEHLPLPDPSRRFPVLLAIAGRERGRMYHLDKPRLVIGRGEHADIVIDDVGISRSHAAIEVERERLRVLDLGSRNGVLVNGLGVDEHELEDGDRIQVGTNTIFKFAWADELEERYQAELHHSATTDPLTGVKHRAAFLEQLRTECSFARRHKVALGLLVFQLDDFADLNRAHGALAGDAVLAETGKRVLDMLRAEDFIGRLNGERFGVLLRGLEQANAEIVAERVRDVISKQPITWRSTTMSVTATAAVTGLLLDARDTPQELLDAALRMLDAQLE
jgi:diguanylate cyclase (GGDEF)-like protein